MDIRNIIPGEAAQRGFCDTDDICRMRSKKGSGRPDTFEEANIGESGLAMRND